MTTPKLFWVAWMSRWGEPSPTHAYAAGVFSDPDKAKEVGETESQHRGGKYVFQHCPTYLNLDQGTGDKWPKSPSLIEVHVAWVEGMEDQDSLKNGRRNRCHFLGVFSTREKGRSAGSLLYPGWQVGTARFTVDKIPEK